MQHATTSAAAVVDFGFIELPPATLSLLFVWLLADVWC
jgi:hypothetical protein